MQGIGSLERDEERSQKPVARSPKKALLLLAPGFWLPHSLFDQTFDPHDLIVIGVLVVLEGVLSLDNALVLGLLARQLPARLQPRALMYGLVGAFVFRVIAILLAGFLLSWHLPKLLGGLYLLYVAVKHFATRQKPLEVPLDQLTLGGGLAQ